MRTSVPMSFGLLHVAPLVSDFLASYPGIEVDLIMDDHFVDMISEGVDVAIRGGSMEDSSLIARRIAPIHNVLVAAPSYIERCGEPSSIEDLASHNCLQYSLTRDFQEWVFETKRGTRNIQISGSYRVNNGEALRQAIVGGVGIGRLPTFIVGSDLASGRLVKLLPQYQMPTQSLFAVFPERRHLPIKVRLFLDFIVDRLGGYSPEWDN
ncbi:MAG: substrate binding domain-containing protein [Paracoccaceae bacterium]